MEDLIATTIWRHLNAGANDQQMAAAILKALNAAGKKIVDIEPTAEMIEAGCSDMQREVEGRPLWKQTTDIQAREIFKAMIENI